ncbi:hypothetical protein LOTGIDRAFT_160937 [Lottia gigantea]|uniref:Domain of unknown function with conserved HDNR motif domain-containing protein n=1 Tax=Lottia gigantea TaxID=225164 RepID=V4ANH1_LOTGI|nr:hypothetical protein LOTGIDRAFT_160937 [Lottia gigantea]ESO95171.1 hypothetical protein LOTGIDRAFT_160937 [Lottia gigantea]
MVKGRMCVPSNETDGLWFQHIGTEKNSLERSEATSTGRMMSAPFDSRNRNKPAPPPTPFTNKNDEDSNKFSEHDNRHLLQSDGSYFGNGKETRNLGRHLASLHKRQHLTDSYHLGHPSHRVDPPYYIDTEYRTCYMGNKTEFPPVHRRFPKLYSAPKEGRIPLDTTTSDWFQQKEPTPKTPLRVMAISQQPFLKHNPFKYSYHGTPKVYPSY